MKKYITVLACSLFLSSPAWSGEMIDDPLLSMVIVDQLEVQVGDGDDPLVWEAEGWLGYDLNKLWLKTDGEYLDGRIEDVEVQALYSRAIAPFWDVQIGWRGDLRPQPERNWLALGVKGLAPYFFDVDAAVFIGESGQTAARLQAEYEIMFTRKLILVPDVEVNFHGRDDEELGIGSGLSDIEAGLRLRYEIRREFAPYVGITWKHLYGDTADFAEAEGEDRDDVRFVIGLRAWF
ncbi:MAG: copper resistance protein B [Desulfobulbus sp.]|nr:MAG: copper resistance protein B [Desulfobulbus sp.]RUM40520.1 MAG: copper resistance protein B [Desulfobulbus sp.]